MRSSTYETLSQLMHDINSELTQELQDEVERLEFFYSMAGNQIRVDSLIMLLHNFGYDPRPVDNGIPESIKQEMAEVTGNGDKVQPEAVAAMAKRRGGRPKGSKNKVKKNGKSRTYVHEPAV